MDHRVKPGARRSPMPNFTAFADLRAICLDLPSGHPAASGAVAKREDTLTKPPKSLGRLEELTAFLAHWQGHAPPRLDAHRGAGVCRQSRRHRAGRLRLSGRGHGADGGEFRLRRRRHQPARPRRRRRAPRHSAVARPTDRRLHRHRRAERSANSSPRSPPATTPSRPTAI